MHTLWHSDITLRDKVSVIADIGAIIEVTPWDDVWHKTSDDPCEYLSDRAPFRFHVEGRLEDGQIFYGLHGRVTEGPARYHDLICSIMVRGDGSDWRVSQQCQANFKVGPSMARRDHCFDFRHPDGTIVDGYPVFGRFGSIEVVDENYPRARRFPPQREAIWREGGLVRVSSNAEPDTGGHA